MAPQRGVVLRRRPTLWIRAYATGALLAQFLLSGRWSVARLFAIEDSLLVQPRRACEMKQAERGTGLRSSSYGRQAGRAGVRAC